MSYKILIVLAVCGVIAYRLNTLLWYHEWRKAFQEEDLEKLLQLLSHKSGKIVLKEKYSLRENQILALEERLSQEEFDQTLSIEDIQQLHPLTDQAVHCQVLIVYQNQPIREKIHSRKA